MPNAETVHPVAPRKLPAAATRVPALFDNAVLFKDLAQWLHTRVFVGLFFWLLTLAQILALFIALLVMAQETYKIDERDIVENIGGPLVFNILFIVLAGFGAIVALTGHIATTREFESRTFELYELSGISLEQMVRGKLFSMLIQFLFGFFCLAPFMIFSFLLGGLDFLEILDSLLLLLLLAPPLYLVMLAAVLYGYKVRHLGPLIRSMATLEAFAMFPAMVVLVFVAIVALINESDAPLIGHMIPLLQILFHGSPGALWLIFGITLIYAILLAFLFYLNCHALSPITDSREPHIKLSLFLFTLVAFAMAGLALLTGGDKNIGIATVFGTCLFWAAFGVLFFWAPLEVPMMARRRQTESRWLPLRLFHFWFQVGPWGTFRTILGVWALTWIFYLTMRWTYKPSVPAYDSSLMDALQWLLSLLLGLPFYLSFPASLITWFKKLNNHPLATSLGVFTWWLFAGILVICIAGICESMLGSDHIMIELLVFCGIVISPLSNIIAPCIGNSVMAQVSPQIRMTLGVIGIYLMLRTLLHRQRLVREALRATLAPREASASAPPLPLRQPGEAMTLESAEATEATQ